MNDPQGIRDRIREQLATMTFQSLMGGYHVDATGRQQDKPLYIIQWQDGHRSLIAPTEIARWKLKFPFPAWSTR
jgi:ABC-type branched-subunit amino acid transport system substrate-binding protein